MVNSLSKHGFVWEVSVSLLRDSWSTGRHCLNNWDVPRGHGKTCSSVLCIPSSRKEGWMLIKLLFLAIKNKYYSSNPKQIFFSDESSFLIHCPPLLTLYREKGRDPSFCPFSLKGPKTKQNKTKPKQNKTRVWRIGGILKRKVASSKQGSRGISI